MDKELTWTEAIIKVLSSSLEPLHCPEISERIALEGYRTNITSTPNNTVSACITTSLKDEGRNSPYIKISRGVYDLREKETNNILPTELTSGVYKSENSEEQSEIITSFGMFWQRDAVSWTSEPEIFGIQQLGATHINFFKQIGVYLLYDGREIIYVGRAINRPLGKRLYEHTKDRLSARWDRFSWFGLLPISNTGEINHLPNSYSSEKLIDTLEAILIEALEPRQNRKRGDDLSAVEYLQEVSPEIEKKKALEVLSRPKA